MALIAAALKTSLELNWLVPEGGTFPQSAEESADRFATAVANWFSAAQANGIPCTTAQARKSQLGTAVASAFKTRDAALAGQGLANALSAYLTGQSFGAGVSNAPLGTALATTAFSSAFANLQLGNSARAQAIAGACQALALTTIVIFPAPMPPANVM